jgi:NADH dehydrogenase FAD-containing subunit
MFGGDWRRLRRIKRQNSKKGAYKMSNTQEKIEDALTKAAAAVIPVMSRKLSNYAEKMLRKLSKFLAKHAAAKEIIETAKDETPIS